MKKLVFMFVMGLMFVASCTTTPEKPATEVTPTDTTVVESADSAEEISAPADTTVAVEEKAE